MNPAPHPFRNALLVYVVIFGTSLFAAYILYGVLSSTGTFENKGAQLGGAAAGFVVVFGLSATVFSRMFRNLDTSQKESVQQEDKQTISRLQATIDQLLAAQLAPAFVPAGFLPLVSRDEGLAYAHPTDWIIHTEKTIGQYFRPTPPPPEGQQHFAGNITVTNSSLAGVPRAQLDDQTQADALMDVSRENIIHLLSSTNVTSERAIVGGLNGRRYRGQYVHFKSGESISFDLILAIDARNAKLLCFALHDRTDAIETSRAVLLTIVSTVKTS